MAIDIDLIYCAAGNKDFAKIAIDSGFLYGAQVPNTVYFPPYFCDQDWEHPNFDKYMGALAKHKPHLASVLDWERKDQLPEVLGWAESAAQYAEVIMIIPKVIGGVREIPSIIGGKPIRLGYSVPTKHGGTAVPYSEFKGRQVHLLGGSPQKQKRLCAFLDVVSLDGNMHQKMANEFCSFFVRDKSKYKNGHWAALKDVDGKKWGNGSDSANAPYEAFRRSCKNIMEMWRGVSQKQGASKGGYRQMGMFS